MKFSVLKNGIPLPRLRHTQQAFLIEDNWDDWFQYSTQYYLIYRDATGKDHSIGSVKIGQFDMPEEQRRPAIPERFEKLNEIFFSVGQDDSYYEELNRQSAATRNIILTALRDIALDSDLYDRAANEDVTEKSLLRSVSRRTVQMQFRRMAAGGARLSPYQFGYESAPTTVARSSKLTLQFHVVPESSPPTNVHVLIGRNGVGKTHVLNNMTRALVDSTATESEVGHFFGATSDHTSPFSSLVSVSFSAFDSFEPGSIGRSNVDELRYSYIGLKRLRKAGETTNLPPKSPSAFAAEFGKSVRMCLEGPRQDRWRRALEMLQSDPIFADARVSDLADPSLPESDLRENAKQLFRRLSSGHKIVLLTITRLVETIEEKALVLLDEPEAHLHPPLLAAFVRALSDLLVNRNGVALIATHSPVVLQEVPRSCVWKLRRSGTKSVAERPAIETFGENVGTLTREVFGLEVTQSGFHRILSSAIDGGASYAQIIQRFEGQIGSEARAIVRALIAEREAR